jgi:uncharacterized caspase-like protein
VLAAKNTGSQSFVMLATKDGEVAADGPGGRHSPFSQALLNNIETKGLDISGLARNVRKEVREATNNRQVPLTIGSLDEAFYFLPPGKDTSKKTLPTSAIDTADQAYRDAVSDGSEAKLRAFVEAYPNHSKAADLKLMLDERDSWRNAERSNTRDAYERYLLAFPKGLYAKAARERIAVLASQGTEASLRKETGRQPLPETQSFAPSFNCKENMGRTEQAICGSRRLSQLDVTLTQIYTLFYNRLSRRRGIALRNTQRQWLKMRDACGARARCIKDAYITRIQQLRGMGG